MRIPVFTAEPASAAYPVPWRVCREGAPRFRLINVSGEPVLGVTLALLGTGMLLSAAPRRLGPGQSLAFTLRADDAARSTIVVVRWFREDRSQYLWRVSF